MNNKYEKHAKDLAKPLLELIEQCVIKQHIAIIEEMHDQIKQRDSRIDRLENTLKTCIAWQAREFGQEGVNQLLKMLESETKE